MQRMRTGPSEDPSILKELRVRRGGSSIENHMRGFRLLAFITIAFGVVNELSEPATDTRYTNCEREPVSLETILRVLREQFPSLRVVTGSSHGHEHLRDTYIGPESITCLINRMFHAAFYSPRTDENGSREGIVDYLNHYRLSRAEAAEVPAAVLDCNDHTQQVCETLDERNIPLYMVSTWAHNLEDGFKDWHIFTVCKMNDRLFVIVDNSRVATIWEGTLQSFLQQYSTNSAKELPKVRVVPFGISPFCEAKHPYSICKIMVQVRTSVPSEEWMESVGENEDTLLTSANPRD